MAALNIPDQNVTGFIQTLAKSKGVSYTETRLDKVSRIVTRLAGDDVRPDNVEGLLLNLNRMGFIAGSDMMALHSRYLDELKTKLKYQAPL